MDDYKEESKAVDEALAKMMTEKGGEAIKEFQEKLEAFGQKFGEARKTEVAACFCGNEIADPTEQEISPSMYYWKRRTCSVLCHNLWILGRFDGMSRPVGKGWWSILDNLYDDIYEIDRDCHIVQIKEKFGTLRFYADYTEPELPLGITKEEVWALGAATSNLYYEIKKYENPGDWLGEGVEYEPLPDWKINKIRNDYEALKSLADKLHPIEALIRKAEEESAVTCEWCGEPGTIDTSGGWLLTLCDGCKADRANGKRPWDDGFEV